MAVYMRIILVASVFGLFGLNGLTEGAFPLFLPTTNAYYKPSPFEQVFLGLALVKLLAKVLFLRVTSVTGFGLIPSILGKRSIPDNTTRVVNHHYHLNSRSSFDRKKPAVKISKQEMLFIERILLSLRRMDTSDCFIRTVCELNQNSLEGRSNAAEERFLQVFKLREITGAVRTNSKKWSAWDAFEDATKLEKTDCTKKYQLCSLPRKELEIEALLTGLY